jgi:hypothetical protein
MSNKVHYTNLSFIGRFFVLVLSVCYLLSPLHQTLKHSIHDISHAISKVEAQQHEHQHIASSKMGRRTMAHHHSHNTHQHKALSFFNALFDGDSIPDENLKDLEIKVDKRVVDIETPIFKSPILSQDHTFSYILKLTNLVRGLDSPPPEYLS